MTCFLGHRHWGQDGAAGLFLVAAGRLLLVAHPAPARGSVTMWALPSSARERGENAQHASLREASSAIGVQPDQVVVFAEFVDNHGGWTYTTIMARAGHCLDVLPPDKAQSTVAEWVDLDAVQGRALHPELEANFAQLRKLFEDSPPG